MHKVASAVALLLAAAVAVFMTALAYGITSEYSATPNGGGLGEAVSWTAGFAAPAALAVTALVALGTVRTEKRRRRRLLVGAVVLPVLAVSLAVLLGAQR